MWAGVFTAYRRNIRRKSHGGLVSKESIAYLFRGYQSHFNNFAVHRLSHCAICRLSFPTDAQRTAKTFLRVMYNHVAAEMKSLRVMYKRDTSASWFHDVIKHELSPWVDRYPSCHLFRLPITTCDVVGRKKNRSPYRKLDLSSGSRTRFSRGDRFLSRAASCRIVDISFGPKLALADLRPSSCVGAGLDRRS